MCQTHSGYNDLLKRPTITNITLQRHQGTYEDSRLARPVLLGATGSQRANETPCTQHASLCCGRKSSDSSPASSSSSTFVRLFFWRPPLRSHSIAPLVISPCLFNQESCRSGCRMTKRATTSIPRSFLLRAERKTKTRGRAEGLQNCFQASTAPTLFSACLV